MWSAAGLMTRADASFRDDRHLLQIIDRIVSRVGRRVDESSPMVDARLPDGSRVNAIIPPLALDGPSLSIRRFGTGPLAANQLVQLKSISAEMMELLSSAVRARLSILISGGTGAGKTTFLNILSQYIPQNERIITIEDAAELQLAQENIVRLETRPPNVEGQGAIRQRQLLINCLRMRPDRIVIGECRGEEAFDMLQAMNTGHEGSMTTVHANTARDALTRLESMVAMTNLNLPEKTVRQQVASAIDDRGAVHAPERWLAQMRKHSRDHGHGRERDQYAGNFHVPEKGDRAEREGAWRVQAERHPSPLPRAASHRGHLPAAEPVRTGYRSQLSKKEVRAAMGLIAFIVFVPVFAVVALVAAASGAGASKQDKEMLARLDSALATGKAKSDMSDLLIDVRKNELLSTIPWIDKALRKVELTPRLRRLLYQANLKWTVGGLMLMCLVCLRSRATLSIGAPGQFFSES